MPNDNSLLSWLVCPETHTPLRAASPEILDHLNARIANGALRSRGGELIREPIQAGLLRSDGAYLYPIRNDIPVLLIDASIATADLS